MRIAVVTVLAGLLLALVFWAVAAAFFAPAIDYRYDPDLKRDIKLT